MSNLDELIIKNGQELDETTMKTTSTEEILKTSKLAYDDSDIMSDLPIFPSAEDVTLSKEEAEKHAIYEVAKNKLERENAAYKKLSDEEKIKDYILKSSYYSETNKFYHKYGYEMTGAQKRTLKRELERAWKKGKFKLTEDEKTEILVQLANAIDSKPTTDQVAKPANQIDKLNSLTALTFKG